MKKTVELESNSWGLRGAHNLWLPGKARPKNDCELNDVFGDRKAVINFSALFGNIDIPDGTKVTLTIDVPREKGWYRVKHEDGDEQVLYYDGGSFREYMRVKGTGDSEVRIGGGAVYRDSDLQWISDSKAVV